MSTELRSKAKRMSQADPLKNLTFEGLAGEAVSKMKVIDAAKIELEKIKVELETRFPAEKAEEAIPTVYGVIKRTVKTAWNVNPKKIERIKTILGAEYGFYIEDKATFEIAADKIPALREYLGDEAFDECILTTPKFTCTAKLRGVIRTDPKLKRKLEGMVTEVPSPPIISITPVDEPAVSKREAA